MPLTTELSLQPQYLEILNQQMGSYYVSDIVLGTGNKPGIIDLGLGSWRETINTVMLCEEVATCWKKQLCLKKAYKVSSHVPVYLVTI